MDGEAESERYPRRVRARGIRRRSRSVHPIFQPSTLVVTWIPSDQVKTPPSKGSDFTSTSPPPSGPLLCGTVFEPNPRFPSPRQLPTDHDYAVPTREYQSDQSSRQLPHCYRHCCSKPEVAQGSPSGTCSWWAARRDRIRCTRTASSPGKGPLRRFWGPRPCLPVRRSGLGAIPRRAAPRRNTQRLVREKAKASFPPSEESWPDSNKTPVNGT